MAVQPRLKDYILAERLGNGTYAVVYKAYRKVINISNNYLLQVNLVPDLVSYAFGKWYIVRGEVHEGLRD